MRSSSAFKPQPAGSVESRSHGIILCDYPLGYPFGYPLDHLGLSSWIICFHYPGLSTRLSHVHGNKSICESHSSSARFGRRVTRPERVAEPLALPLSSFAADRAADGALGAGRAARGRTDPSLPFFGFATAADAGVVVEELLAVQEEAGTSAVVAGEVGSKMARIGSQSAMFSKSCSR